MPRTRSGPRLRTVVRMGRAAVLAAIVLTARAAHAQAPTPGAAPAPSAAPSAEATAAPAEPTPDPRTAQVKALQEGTLPTDVDAEKLFDVPLADDVAVQVEAVRIRALLREIDESTRPAPLPARKPRPKEVVVPPTLSDIRGIDPAAWAARLDLDRARLEVYSLDGDARRQLLAVHDARREAAKPKETDAEKRAREAEAERLRVLEAARLARSEAERVVAEELARLIGIEQAITSLRASFEAEKAKIQAMQDGALAWQRRAREAKTASAEEVDATYDALRQELRATRDQLDQALVDSDVAASRVPEVGADALLGIPDGIATSDARERRALVERERRTALEEEVTLREAKASTLLDISTSLNRERLGLIASLSPAKRSAITGFTPQGLDQAKAEARQVTLLLRQHRQRATQWLGAARASGSLGVSAWKVLPLALPWLLILAALAWWRRRRPALLALAEQRLIEQEAARQATSFPRRALHFFSGIRRPLEGLALFFATVWLLPAAVRNVLEVEILILIAGWILAGSLVVHVIDSIAAATDAGSLRTSDEAGRLRLRSLRLVGRTVVVFALILLVSARVVGQGTVYRWVLSTCWFAALPLFLVLVRWWRETVFERVARVRKKSPLQTWVLANRRGWKSFLAAMIAAVQLFSLGSFKTLRNWLGGFDLARRGLAYLFKRELDRLAGEKSAALGRPLGEAALASLHPGRTSEAWLEGPAATEVAAIVARVRSGAGGLVAIIAPRGLGKSSLLRHLQAEVAGSRLFACHAATTASALLAVLDPGPGEEAPPSPPLVLLDDAQSLFRPVLGGLKRFDEALAMVRTRAHRTVWVFAIDSVLWPFLSRARDSRPLFDQTFVLEDWSDGHIGELLTQRSQEAGVTPLFDGLLEKLPPSSDEIDRQEALAARRQGYFRMIWDYARGNPAIALEAWRSSLAEPEAQAGETEDEAAAVDGTAEKVAADDGAPAPEQGARATLVRVLPLKVPDGAKLEELPDAALFVLRAVLQMEPATADLVAEATRISKVQVQNTFRFGKAHGYLVEDGDGVRVAWPWLRAVFRHLERRHLLVNP